MTDGVTRVERLLNLLALLLDSDRHLTRVEITTAVGGYPESEVASRRAFERDKETLRAMGVPLNLNIDAAGESRYRVLPSEYFLTDPGLTGEETAALQVAVSAVALGSSSVSGEGALLKLGTTRLASTPPIAALAVVPSLSTLFEGYRTRAALEFRYNNADRVVEPWGLHNARGRWYLVGFDTTRGERRTFRADRIVGDINLGPSGTVVIPDDADTQSVGEHPWDLGSGEPMQVEIAIDPPHHLGAIEQLGPDAHVSHLDDGRVLVQFDATNVGGVRNFVLGFLDHAEVIGPESLRGHIIDWLTRLREASAPNGAVDRGAIA